MAKQKSMITPVDKRPIKVEGRGASCCRVGSGHAGSSPQGDRACGWRLDHVRAQFTRGHGRDRARIRPRSRAYLTVDVDVEKPGEQARGCGRGQVLLSLVKVSRSRNRPGRGRGRSGSCLLTRLCRSHDRRACPMFTSTGNSAGVGKGPALGPGLDDRGRQGSAREHGLAVWERDLKDEVVSTLIASPAADR